MTLCVHYSLIWMEIPEIPDLHSPQCINIWDVSKGSANLKAFDSDRCHSRRESLMKTMNIRHETCWAEADESTDHSFGSHWSPQMNSTFLKKGTIVSWQTDVFCSNDDLEGQMSSCSLPHSPRFWLCGCVELTLLTPQTLWISRSCARDTCRQDNQMESSRHLVASADFPLASTIVLCVSGGPAVNCRPREVRWLCFDCYVCPWPLIRPFLFLIPRVLPLIQNISILVGSCPYSLASICWSITLTFSGLILCPCKTKRGIPPKIAVKNWGTSIFKHSPNLNLPVSWW